MKDLISPAIHDITQTVLADYDNGRPIDKLDVFNQPDTRVIYEIVNELIRIAFPGFSKDEYYRIYDIRNNLSMVIEDIAFRLNKQISIALRYGKPSDDKKLKETREQSQAVTLKFLAKIQRFARTSRRMSKPSTTAIRRRKARMKSSFPIRDFTPSRFTGLLMSSTSCMFQSSHVS